MYFTAIGSLYRHVVCRSRSHVILVNGDRIQLWAWLELINKILYFTVVPTKRDSDIIFCEVKH